MIRIRMLTTIRPDLIFLATPGTILREGMEYQATANKNGAVCGICENGKELGVKPDEFEFVELPQWLYDIWSKHSPITSATIVADGKEEEQHNG